MNYKYFVLFAAVTFNTSTVLAKSFHGLRAFESSANENKNRK